MDSEKGNTEELGECAESFYIEQVCGHCFTAQRQKSWHVYREDSPGRKTQDWWDVVKVSLGVPRRPK